MQSFHLNTFLISLLLKESPSVYQVQVSLAAFDLILFSKGFRPSHLLARDLRHVLDLDQEIGTEVCHQVDVPVYDTLWLLQVSKRVHARGEGGVHLRLALLPQILASFPFQLLLIK